MSSRRLTQAELLQWSVLNTATASEDAPNAPTQDLQPIDPKWIDIILGKEDAVRMKECVAKAMDADSPLESRIAAFDELELLVESIDNANDLRPAKLWPPIISLATSNLPQIRMYAAWVLGTAVQNNPKAQKDFLASGGLGPMLKLLEHDTDPDVRAKAFYCVSGAVRHNKTVFDAFCNANGFQVVFNALQNAESSLLRRAIFFWRNLLLNEDVVEEDRTSYAAPAATTTTIRRDDQNTSTSDAPLGLLPLPPSSDLSSNPVANNGMNDSTSSLADTPTAHNTQTKKSTPELAASAAIDFGVATMALSLVESNDASDIDLYDKCIDFVATLAQVCPRAIDAEVIRRIQCQVVPSLLAQLERVKANPSSDHQGDVESIEAFLEKLGGIVKNRR